jgi:predicted anti-sigma-YlaC factor YlaD
MYLVDKTVPGLITCAEAESFIDDYLDGALPPSVHARFERHIRICKPCLSYLNAYQRTIELAKASTQDSVLPRMPEELTRAILKARYDDPSG